MATGGIGVLNMLRLPGSEIFCKNSISTNPCEAKERSETSRLSRRRSSKQPTSDCNKVPRKFKFSLLLAAICSASAIICSTAYASMIRCEEINSSADEPFTFSNISSPSVDGDKNDKQNNPNTLTSQLVQFDDDDDGDDSDDEDDEESDDYLDEDEFYNQNPARLASGGQLGADIKVNDSDFDDHEVFKTSEFYAAEPRRDGNEKVGTRNEPHANHTFKKQTRARPILKDTRKEALSSEGAAVAVGGRRRLGAASCALLLSRGDCITYRSLEWAIRRARKLVRYARPAGLGARQPPESTVGAVGELNEMTTRLLASRFALSGEEVSRELESIDVSQTSLWRECPRAFRSPAPARCAAPINSRFRSHSGRCNNLFGPHLGSAMMPFVRFRPPDYGDGVGMARRARFSGAELPPARLVAIHLHPDVDIFASTGAGSHLSALFMGWGQLINHDLAQASTARDSTGHERNCCAAPTSRARGRGAPAPDDTQLYLSNCMPILMEPDDPVYGPFGVRCHEFKRSLAGLRPGCSLGPRTQINTITSYLDGSFVYGSSASASRSLRAMGARGQLKMWPYFGRQRNTASAPAPKPLLPAQLEAPDEECLRRPPGLFCFRSGDSRTNQHVQLVVLHTIHARQHNRLARGLAALNPHWSDSRLYQEARRIHVALLQHIILSEYLPELLGAELCEKYHLIETTDDQYWQGYDPALNAGVSQEFAAAAFRQGHSSVPSQVGRFDPVSHEPLRFYALRRLFRQPWALFEPGAMDEFLAGLLEVPAKAADPFMSGELSGHLLEVPGEPLGLDLASMNVQRGRDQGLAGYNTYRDWCGLGRVESFGELDAFMSNRSSSLMAQLYEHVDDIDLFTGGLSEFPLEGAQVGPTFACLIGRQFELLRSGDRFWFENGPETSSPAGGSQSLFTLAQLASIKQVSLARLLCANSDNLLEVQARAFRLAHPILNPRQPCDSLPDLELALWFEPPGIVPPANMVAAEDEYDDDNDDNDEEDDEGSW